MAKGWRTGQEKQLDATMLVADKDNIFNITGSGNVISPPKEAFAVGSGGHFAQGKFRFALRNFNSRVLQDLNC